MPQLMRILRLAQAGITHPFGDARAVTQAFPSAIPSTLSDPFLMCDDFDMPSPGIITNPDEYFVDWHPHRGQLVLSYFKTGIGRHADSMGNRETFSTPGLQWIIAGSGIEHAEGGGTPAGEEQQGFQIWINLPSKDKMMDPKYGTESPESIPLRDLFPKDNGEGFSFTDSSRNDKCVAGNSLVRARLLSGSFDGHIGPVQSIAKVQILDLEVDAGGNYIHLLPQDMDTCMIYVYDGSMVVNNSEVAKLKDVVLFDTISSSDFGTKGFHVHVPADSSKGAKAMIFIGRKLNEPIAWRGPIVMNTQEEINQCMREIRSGKFPPVRAPWDYRRIITKPH